MTPRRALHNELMSHTALKSLGQFGEHLKQRPLDGAGRRHLFASLRTFFKPVPTGILALAMRVSDDWEEHEPLEGTAKGAYILFADVDEYGLQKQHEAMQPTHHQLFRELSLHLGILVRELDSAEYVVPAARELAEKFVHYYRNAEIPEGLGLHLASEITSSQEFVYFLKGFQAHAAHYGLSGPNDPLLEFFRLHTTIEPLHRDNGWRLIEMYHARDAGTYAGVRRGALAFLDSFEQLFEQLDRRIYAR